MAALAAIPAWVPVAATVAGTVLGMAGAGKQAQGAEIQAAAARRTGEQRRAASEFEAEQLQVQAGQSVAAAQRDALEQDRQAKLIESRAIALAAAGGGGASDATVVKLVSQISGEGAYRRMAEIYKGDERARQLRMAAAGKRVEGAIAQDIGQSEGAAYEAKAKAARISGVATLFQGAGSLFGKYGGAGPGTSVIAGSGGEAAILDAGTDAAAMAALA